MDTVIVRYGELTLKSESVRAAFEDLLVRSIKRTAGEDCAIERERGRIFLKTTHAVSAAEKISKLPGVVSTSPAISTGSGMDEIIRAVIRAVDKKIKNGESFAVRTTRFGDHPYSSMDVNRAAGSAILKMVKGARVDLTSPDFEVGIEVRGKNAYVFTETFPGTGGLPAGSQGALVALMTGKLHDAVAVYLGIKRGAAVFPIFIHSGRRSDDAARKRALKQITVLRAVCPDIKLMTVRVPPGKVSAVKGNTKRDLMIRKLSEVAEKIGASGIVTGYTLEDTAKAWEDGEVSSKEKHILFTPVAGLDEDTVEMVMKKSGLWRCQKKSKGKKTRKAGI